MAVRVTQAAIEVVGQADANVRATQSAVEALTQGGSVRVTQVAVEVLILPAAPIRVSQAGVEVIRSSDEPPLQVTQAGVEVIRTSDDPPLRVTQAGIEVVWRPAVTGSFSASAVIKRTYTVPNTLPVVRYYDVDEGRNFEFSWPALDNYTGYAEQTDVWGAQAGPIMRFGAFGPATIRVRSYGGTANLKRDGTTILALDGFDSTGNEQSVDIPSGPCSITIENLADSPASYALRWIELPVIDWSPYYSYPRANANLTYLDTPDISNYGGYAEATDVWAASTGTIMSFTAPGGSLLRFSIYGGSVFVAFNGTPQRRIYGVDSTGRLCSLVVPTGGPVTVTLYDPQDGGPSFAFAKVEAFVQSGLTLDASIVRTSTGSFGADAVIDASVPDTQLGSFGLSADIQKTLTGTFTASALVSVPVSGSFTGSALILWTQTGSLSLDAQVGTPPVLGDFSADAVVFGTQTGSFAVSAVVVATWTGTFGLSAEIVSFVGSFSIDAQVLDTVTGSFAAGAVVRATQSGAFSLSASASFLGTGDFSISAVIQRTVVFGAVEQYFADTFTRTVSGGLGGGYVTDYISGTVGVNGSEAYAGTHSYGTFYNPTIPYELSDFTVEFDFYAQTPGSGGSTEWVQYTWVNLGRWFVDFWPSPKPTSSPYSLYWELGTYSPWAYSSGTVQVDGGSWYRVKVVQSGDTAYLRLWKIGTAEPETWLSQRNNAGATAYPFWMEIDAPDHENGLFDNLYVYGESANPGISASAVFFSERTGSFGLSSTFRSIVERQISFSAEFVSFVGSFDASALLYGTVERFFRLSSLFFKAGVTHTFSLDAGVAWSQSGSVTFDSHFFATINRTLDISSVVRRTDIAYSFGISANVREPEFVSPGTTDTISIVIDGLDITTDVIYSRTEFVSQVNGNAGHCRIAILDRDRTLSFRSGQRINVKVNNLMIWTGYAMRVRRTYPFEASSPAERTIEIEGVDINILFSKRVVYNKANLADGEGPKYPPYTLDTTALRALMDNFLDLSEDDLDTRSRITSLGTLNEDQNATPIRPSGSWAESMRYIANWLAPVWYINPDRQVVWGDVDVEDAPFELSDNPSGAQVGVSNLQITRDGTSLINDILLIGAGGGSPTPVSKRVQDTDSITEHNRSQFGAFISGIWKQATIDKVATSYINGSTTSKRGHKDDKVVINATVFQHGLRAGHKVRVVSSVWGYDDVIPIRQLRLRWVTPSHPRYELTLTHELDTAWSFFDPVPLPDAAQLPPTPSTPKPPDLPPTVPPPPVNCVDSSTSWGCVVDTFTRVIPETHPIEPDVPSLGVSDSGVAWIEGPWHDIFLDASSVEVDGSKAIISLGAGDIANFLLPVTSSGSLNVLVKGSAEIANDAYGSEWGLYFRADGGNQYQNVLVNIATTTEYILFGSGYQGTVYPGQLWITYPDGSYGSSTTPVTVLTGDFELNKSFWVKVSLTADGTNAKVWWDGTVEPAAWQIADDHPPGFIPNRAGTFMYMENNAEDFMAVFTIDEFVVCGGNTSGDSFNRTVSGSWDGGLFTSYQLTLGGAGAVASVNGSSAVLTNTSTSNGLLRYGIIPPMAWAYPINVYARFTLPSASSAYTSNWTCRWYSQGDGLPWASMAFSVRRKSDGSGITLDPYYQYQLATDDPEDPIWGDSASSTKGDSSWLGVSLQIRGVVEATGMKMRVWKASGDEPATWDLEVTFQHSGGLDPVLESGDFRTGFTVFGNGNSASMDFYEVFSSSGVDPATGLPYCELCGRDEFDRTVTGGWGTGALGAWMNQYVWEIPAGGYVNGSAGIQEYDDFNYGWDGDPSIGLPLVPGAEIAHPDEDGWSDSAPGITTPWEMTFRATFTAWQSEWNGKYYGVTQNIYLTRRWGINNVGFGDWIAFEIYTEDNGYPNYTRTGNMYCGISIQDYTSYYEPWTYVTEYNPVPVPGSAGNDPFSYRVKIRADTTYVACKVWADGAAEPEAWGAMFNYSPPGGQTMWHYVVFEHLDPGKMEIDWVDIECQVDPSDGTTTPISGYYCETLEYQGIQTFTTSAPYTSGTLSVSINGVAQTDFTETSPATGVFTVNYTLAGTTSVYVCYLVASSGTGFIDTAPGGGYIPI